MRLNLVFHLNQYFHLTLQNHSKVVFRLSDTYALSKEGPYSGIKRCSYCFGFFLSCCKIIF